MELPSTTTRARTSSLGAPLTSSLETSDEPRLDLPLARRPADEPKAGNRPVGAPAPSVQLSATTTPDPGSNSSLAPLPALQRLASTESSQPLTMASSPTAPSPHVSASRLPLVTESLARDSAFSAVPARDAATMAPLVGTMPLRPSGTLQRSALPRLEDDAPDPETPPQGGRDLSFAKATEDTPQPDPPAQGGRELPSMRRREDGVRQPLLLAPSRGFAVQRAAQAVDDAETDYTEAPSESDAPVVQGAWYDSISAGVKSLASGAGSSVASTVGSAIGGVASSLGGHKTDETDMDELAGKLYDRIRSRLKTELLVDRERAGFLTDLR